jgi:hypothetical protein
MVAVQATKAYGEMEVLLRLFLNSTLDGKGNAVAHLVEALRYKPGSILMV